MPVTISLDLSAGNLIKGATLTDEERAELSKGSLPGDAVWFRLVTQGDDRVRPSHRALHGTVWKVGDPEAPVPPMDYGCFLEGTRVAGVFDGGSRALYEGEAVEVRTKNGAALRVTPNHPIPTPHGLVPAGMLKPGTKLLRQLPQVVSISGQHVDEKNKPAPVEQVYRSLAELGTVAATAVRGQDFHGDALGFKGKVDIVGSYAKLGRVYNSHSGEDGRHLPFGGSLRPDAFPHRGLGLQCGTAGLLPLEQHAAGGIGSGNLPALGISTHLAPLHSFRLGLAAELDASGGQQTCDVRAGEAGACGYRIDGLPLAVRRNQRGDVDWSLMQALRFGPRPHRYASLYEPSPNGLRLNPRFFTDLPRGFPSEVEVDEVADVVRFAFSGHVYDLRSVFGYVVAEGIYTSNCRCMVEYVAAPESPAAAVLPPAEAVPVPPAEAYADYLTKELDGWQEIARAVTKLAPSAQLNAAIFRLRRAHPDWTETKLRDYGELIVAASSEA